MNTGLGYHVLVVMDHNRASLALIHALINSGSDLSVRLITLICCCPSIYWEHGGGTTAADIADLERELAQADSRYEHTVEAANRVFAVARNLLQEVGVPEAHITTRLCFEGASLSDILRHELQAHAYSTVLINNVHHEVIRRLSRHGVWKLLPRHTPEIAVWAVDVENAQVQVVS